MSFSTPHAPDAGPIPCLIHVVIIGLMLSACGRNEPAGPEVDHAKLSAELEERASEIEAEADASVAAVEREMAADIAEMREAEAAPAEAE
jgi:hypothetical protein